MNTRLSLCCVFVLALMIAPLGMAAVNASDKVDVTGTWLFEVETDQGSGSPTFTFKQDGEKLTGTYKGAFGEAQLTGTVKGNAIDFSFKISGQGMEGVANYTGTVDKDTMKGKLKLGDLASGTFTAKRQEKEKK
jgi:hypothetical protein